MKSTKIEKQVAQILKVLGSPFRIKLLNAIGEGEACVCHLEALLSKRQAYISQHLMVLRDAGLLETRREGKYIFYRVKDNDIFKLIGTAADLQGISAEKLPDISATGLKSNCACPNCEPEFAK